MPVTVRYPLSMTCSTDIGCVEDTPSYEPIVGYEATSIHAHLDSTYDWLVTCILKQAGGSLAGQQFALAGIAEGTTDAYDTNADSFSGDAAGVYFTWIFSQEVDTPTLYTGYVDVTYGDVEPPVSSVSRPPFVQILG